MTVTKVAFDVIADKVRAPDMIVGRLHTAVAISPALRLASTEDEVVNFLAHTASETPPKWRLRNLHLGSDEDRRQGSNTLNGARQDFTRLQVARGIERRSRSRRCSGEDHITTLESQVLGHVNEQWHDATDHL